MALARRRPACGSGKNPPQQRMRDICWDIGTRFPPVPAEDRVFMAMVEPRRGFLCWNAASAAAMRQSDERLRSASLALRVHDVTDLVFDGSSSGAFFDIVVPGNEGKHYFTLPDTGRSKLAELGLRLRDGSFRTIARSEAVFFDRDRPSGGYQLRGLLVSRALREPVPVENVLDLAPYRRLNEEMLGLKKRGSLSVAVVMLSPMPGCGWATPLGEAVREAAALSSRFKVKSHLIGLAGKKAGRAKCDPVAAADALVREACKELSALHRRGRLDLVHCHDWYSAGVGLFAAERLKLPFVLSLHSVEQERAQGGSLSPLSTRICRREKEAAKKARLVMVPRSSTRQEVISLHGLPQEKVVIVPDPAGDPPPGVADAAGSKRRFGLDPGRPVVLFAGELSHASGADLLVDALPDVCKDCRDAQFALVGEGPLRGELEGRAHHAGVGHRCRFLGHLGRDDFESLFSGCEFLVIPARTPQDGWLARRAVECGKPVLTTHQAQIPCVSHGRNGLVTFDNPGSIVWGLKEMLLGPLKGRSSAAPAAKEGAGAASGQSLAVQLAIHYFAAQRARGRPRA